jgi:serine/threonine protein kinase
MNAAEWEHVKRLFTEALARPEQSRRAWLELASDGDQRVFTEVAELLELQATEDQFLIPPDGLESSTMESILDRDLSLGTGGDLRLLGPLPEPGTVLRDRYRLEVLVGAGASGAVYRAQDELTQERVAVKVLRAGQDRESPSFHLEVATLRRARLPGVVEILDESFDAGHAFIVMQWADGTPFPGGHGPDWPSLREPALALTEALERLHWAGIVHRDLKPDNVLVSADGRATIADLGIAWEPSWETAGSVPVAGTPNYLAPELFEGERPNARSDLYALGVLLFQAITGRRPHTCSSLHTLIHARRTEPAPAVLELAPDTPPAVAALIDELLDRDPARRPASASQVAERLSGQDQSPLPTPAAGPDGRYTTRELEALFKGPERILHLPSDAGRELELRTSGDPQAVRAELDRWRRAGLIHREQNLHVIDRLQIGRLRALRADGSPSVDERDHPHRLSEPIDVEIEIADRLRAGDRELAGARIEQKLAQLRGQEH